MEEFEKYLKAMVLLQLASLGDEVEKPELKLSAAGFSAKEIAGMTGKSEAAVSKAISRAKSAGRKKKQ